MSQLPKSALEFEIFLDEPPQYENLRMVRDYRHEAYPKWKKAREDFAAEIAGLRETLQIVRLYVADQMIAHAIVVPKGQHPSGNDPSLLQVIDKALEI